MTHDVEIEKIVAGGDGLGRLDGRVVFVPRAAPGERHRVEIVKQSKDYLRARSLERLTSSPDRRTAACPYYDRCGGCSLMHLTPSAGLEAKRGILLELLSRAKLGDFDGALDLVSSPELGYRSRIRLHVAPGPPGRGPVIGFHRAQSHEVVDVERCLVAAESLREPLERLRQWMRPFPKLGKLVTSVELQALSAREDAESKDRGRVSAVFLVQHRDGLAWFHRNRREELLEATGLDGVVIHASRGHGSIRAGDIGILHSVGERTLRQTAGSFFQANQHLLEPLVRAAMPEARVRRAVDLHCGVGFFSLPLSDHADRVLGVEISRQAFCDARDNARRLDESNVRFRNESAAHYARREGFDAEDFVVVDPPRGGLEKSLCEALGASPVRQLRYVSCDAPAFTRDARRLVAAGMRLERLTLFDLFPNTHHFETVAVFTRTFGTALALGPSERRY